ncbi:MAG TPA: FkbM family methyltransferase [Gaiellaceae bacterium]
MADAWTFRPGTLDQTIFDGVVALDEYRLPECFEPDDVVIDVGAHIGSFAHAVVLRGGEHVWSFEPDRTNYELAAEHLRQYVDQGYVRLQHAAVWRSDPNDDELRFDGYHAFTQSYPGMEGVVNTGNGSVVWGFGEPVAKIAFDDVVDLATNHGEHRVRLLKLDCEGAEWPIVLTSRRLDLIDEIVGEFHELGGPFVEIGEDRPSNAQVFHSDRLSAFTIEELVRFLGDAGFSVAYSRHVRPGGAVEGLGYFFATREPGT